MSNEHSQPSKANLLAVLVLSLIITLATLLYTLDGVSPFKNFDCSVRLLHVSLLGVSSRETNFDETTPRAAELLASDLMKEVDRHVERGRMPRLIHQSWKDSSPPANFVSWADSWRRHHPNWRHVLWTDRDNLDLMERFYPEYLDAYRSLPGEIYRADMARNCYLHRFGGVYADLDVESLRPVEPLLDRPNTASDQLIAYTARMSTTQDRGAMMNSIPNAFMASSAPDHPFWLEPLDYVVAHLHEHLDQPEWLTGPVPLTNLSEAFVSSHEYQLVILPPETIFPYSWDSATPYERCVCSAKSQYLDTGRCKSLFPSAFALTYWAHSWG